jgi:isopenicillin-N epimerase
VVSWGWESETPSGTPFVDYHEWQGTRDMAAFLATPAAIDFQAEHDWDRVRAECYALAVETRRRINTLTGLAALCPDSTDWLGQMVSIRLPPVNMDWLKSALYERYRVEAPLVRWNGDLFLRVSFQGYNDQTDADALVAALRDLLFE